ncbi:MAG: ABC transporter substrate-binding protein [Clostridia bacterium]|nr:ABC transporter substrate-binding protein [Clostridia bacterium]
MKKKLIRLFAALLCMLLLFTACSGTGNPSETSGSAGSDGASNAPGTGDGDKEFAWDDSLPIQTNGTSFPMTVRDFIGNETVLTEKPQRVAILSGAPLNIWYDLGGKSVCTSTISSNLKVVTEYADEIKALPSIGKVTSVNLEAIVEYEPDLIIAQENSQSETIDLLQQWGYKVITTYLRDYDDVVATYRAFGAILGNTELAETKVKALESRYGELLAKKPAEGKRVVILYLTSKKLQVKLDGSIAGIVAKDLGLVNIASGISPTEEGSENATLDIEYLVEQQPDMILVTSMISSNEQAISTMQEHLTTNDAWKGVTAAQSGNIVYLPQEYFLYNAGPYFDEALRYMACSVYPEIYGELDAWYQPQSAD